MHHLLQGVRLQQLEAAAVGVDEPLLLHGAQLPGKGAAVAVEVIRQLDAGEGDAEGQAVGASKEYGFVKGENNKC